MHPDLQALLELQEKDKAVDAARAALDALLPEERALDDELAGLQKALADAHGGVEAANTRRTEQAARITGYKQLQERRRQQLDFVRGPKEAQTLMAEIDMARGVLVKEEADHLRSGDAITEAEKRVADAEKALEAGQETQIEARDALAAKRTEAQAHLETAKAARKKAAADVKPPLLQKYERIRRGRAPAAVFSLIKDSCGHCYTAVPLQRRMQITQGESIESCEVCGVLLYAAES
jgi:predicted  nucleic acid-binding Zn-ribbon protein